MAVAALVPLAEYLRTSYSPDVEYLEGVLRDRLWGELAHSTVQSNLLIHCQIANTGYLALPSVRARVKPERYRIADVSIVRGELPEERFFTSPPFVVAEVLSPEDRAEDIAGRVADFLAFGVAAVWVLDPETKRAFVHKSGASHEVLDGMLREGDLVVPLSAVFSE
jgi:Uma2 family endonuclease